MTRQEIESRLKQCCNRLDLPMESNTTSFASQGIDSLELVELVMEAEKEFQVSVNDDDIPDFYTEKNLEWMIDLFEPLIREKEAEI